MKIDAHIHLWKYNAIRDAWINDDMRIIQRDFLPNDILVELAANNIQGCVVVQSDQSLEENHFQIANAEACSFIKGIVGWVDLQSKDIEAHLQYYQQFKKLKGFRHILQGETDRALMLQPAFKHGISLLNKYGFTYDILIFPDQLVYANELIKAFPQQRFVIDHLAKPVIKNAVIDDWKKDINTIAQHKNVYCKISGMVTEADWNNWKKDDLIPYIDVVINAFGAKRIMFGSDWPVCLLAASYKRWIDFLGEYFSIFTKQEQDNFFGLNAIEFYQLS
jgi:L-fuconolactonase